MTSQLNVDTIVDKAGSGGTNVKIANTSVTVAEGGSATTTTVQGLAKFWCNFVGTSTATLNDNFNVSSLTDNGTGNYDITITNPFASTEYSPSHTTNNFSRYSEIQSTTVFRHISQNNSFANADAGQVYSQGHGDLA